MEIDKMESFENLEVRTSKIEVWKNEVSGLFLIKNAEGKFLNGYPGASHFLDNAFDVARFTIEKEAEDRRIQLVKELDEKYLKLQNFADTPEIRIQAEILDEHKANAEKWFGSKKLDADTIQKLAGRYAKSFESSVEQETFSINSCLKLNERFKILGLRAWDCALAKMRDGETTVVSEVMYDQMFGSVPPITGKGGFIMSECDHADVYLTFFNEGDRKTGRMMRIKDAKQEIDKDHKIPVLILGVHKDGPVTSMIYGLTINGQVKDIVLSDDLLDDMVKRIDDYGRRHKYGKDTLEKHVDQMFYDVMEKSIKRVSTSEISPLEYDNFKAGKKLAAFSDNAIYIDVDKKVYLAEQLDGGKIGIQISTPTVGRIKSEYAAIQKMKENGTGTIKISLEEVLKERQEQLDPWDLLIKFHGEENIKGVVQSAYKKFYPNSRDYQTKLFSKMSEFIAKNLDGQSIESLRMRSTSPAYNSILEIAASKVKLMETQRLPMQMEGNVSIGVKVGLS